MKVVMKKKGGLKFDLNEDEMKNLEDFLKEVPEKHKNKSLKVIFTQSGGIGIGVTAKKGKFKKDITDYARW